MAVNRPDVYKESFVSKEILLLFRAVISAEKTEKEKFVVCRRNLYNTEPMMHNVLFQGGVSITLFGDGFAKSLHYITYRQRHSSIIRHQTSRVCQQEMIGAIIMAGSQRDDDGLKLLPRISNLVKNRL